MTDLERKIDQMMAEYKAGNYSNIDAETEFITNSMCLDNLSPKQIERWEQAVRENMSSLIDNIYRS